MGEVYRADDLKLGQPVALKFLPPDVDRDPARLTQLHTEVRMARQVAHPNVCRVYDIDETDGHTFLSMEYVDGEDLGSLLKRIGRFPQDRAIEVARQICSGLAAAHERGVIHRDFKPANVMLDSAGKVRITDFGLAGASGEVLRAGTPAYMAPEQISRRGGHGTQRHLRARPRALRGLHRPACARRQEPRGADSQARAARFPAAIGDRSRSRSGDRARDHALPPARSGRPAVICAVGRGRAAWRRSAGGRACRRPDAFAGDGGSSRHERRAVVRHDGVGVAVDCAVAGRAPRALPARDADQPRPDAEAAGSAPRSRAGSADAPRLRSRLRRCLGRRDVARLRELHPQHDRPRRIAGRRCARAGRNPFSCGIARVHATSFHLGWRTTYRSPIRRGRWRA